MGILISFVLLLGLMAGMTMTTLAANSSPYTPFLVTTNANKNKSGDEMAALQVNFNGVKWYIIGDESDNIAMGPYITLLAADDTFGSSIFYDTTGATYAQSELREKLNENPNPPAMLGRPEEIVMGVL